MNSLNLNSRIRVFIAKFLVFVIAFFFLLALYVNASNISWYEGDTLDQSMAVEEQLKMADTSFGFQHTGRTETVLSAIPGSVDLIDDLFMHLFMANLLSYLLVKVFFSSYLPKENTPVKQKVRLDR